MGVGMRGSDVGNSGRRGNRASAAKVLRHQHQFLTEQDLLLGS